MKLMRDFYKTSSLAGHGVFMLVVLVLLLLAGSFLPKFKYNKVGEQIYTIKGVNLKYGDGVVVSHFFKSIKENGGYLILGTSETGDLKYGNYYNFLNGDTEIQTDFSFLAGAGRTGGIYIPVFLEHAEEVKNLKVIYFINPVYWGSNLAKVNKAYWTRYSNYGYSQKVLAKNADAHKYYEPVKAYYQKLNPIEKISLRLEYGLRSLKQNYSQDLAFCLDPGKPEKDLLYISTIKSPLEAYPHFGEIPIDEIDTVTNKEYAFTHTEWFKSIDLNEDYRYKELSTFVDLCRDLEIEVTYVIGPYNQRFISHFDPGSLRPYIEVNQNIKKLLEEKDVDYIDATYMSDKAGVFIDYQHHSSYGAYLIYQKIKEHIKDE